MHKINSYNNWHQKYINFAYEILWFFTEFFYQKNTENYLTIFYKIKGFFLFPHSSKIYNFLKTLRNLDFLSYENIILYIWCIKTLVIFVEIEYDKSLILVPRSPIYVEVGGTRMIFWNHWFGDILIDINTIPI